MMVLINVDFFGSDEELEELTKAYEVVGEKTEGVKFLGRFVPGQTKWHYTFFFKAKDMATWASGLGNFKYKRDKSKFTHGAVEFYS